MTVRAGNPTALQVQTRRGRERRITARSRR